MHQQVLNNAQFHIDVLWTLMADLGLIHHNTFHKS